jgi:hypothetical protein
MRAPDLQQSFGATVRVLNLSNLGVHRVPIPAHERRAWRVPCKAQTADQTATLDMWLTNCPCLHMAWSWWWVTVIHLRDIPGVEPAKKDFPQAEYQLTIIAQNPELAPDPDEPTSMRPLYPLDVIEQFHGVTDEQAVQLLETWAKGIVHGQISPDSDFRRAWNEQVRLGVQHFTTGHPKVDA